MAAKNPEHRIIESTDHPATLYYEAHGDTLARLQQRREQQGLPATLEVADVGAGRSDFAERAIERGFTVTPIDFIYAEYPPKHGRYVAADVRNMENIPDNRFDVTVSTFLMQHLYNEPMGVTRAIQEMVRITKPFEQGGGLVLIYPLYGPKIFEQKIQPEFVDVAGFAHTDQAGLAERGLPISGLAIQKSKALTPERAEQLAIALEKSGVLNRRRTIADKIRQIRMNRQGSPFISTNAAKRF